MKIKYYIMSILASTGLMASSCSDFLDETPNKSGSAYIYSIDQLYEMMGSLDLYTFRSPRYVSYGLVNDFMSEVEVLTDAVEYEPYFYSYGLLAGTSLSSYKWEAEDFTTQYSMSTTWTPCWERIFRFNTVLENLNGVEQTTESIQNQVKGEALFGRAYYHFILMTMYCLWEENEPGIGYRESTSTADMPKRETVKYTLEHIYKDLDDAEEALTKAGRTAFDFERNFRPTVPTVQAFRARVELYRGNYDSALQNARNALAAHNTLVTFKDDPMYQLSLAGDFYLLDEAGNVSGSISCKRPTQLMSMGARLIPEYQELYLPCMSAGNPYMSISKWYYNLWDRDNDARWAYFYNYNQPLLMASGLYSTAIVNGSPYPYCIPYANQQWLKPYSLHSYQRFYCNGQGVLLGMTTAEMYLIEAECLARSGQTAEAAEALKTLRRTRFMNEAAADAIGGSVQEALDERSREMGTFWRYFDVKRLNGAEHANIYIRHSVPTVATDPTNTTEISIAPDDPRWALPFYKPEAERMGWEQNPGWE